MNATSPRTLRVFVAGWVIQDGSFPRASVGDIADVALEHYPSDVPCPFDETRTATARPAFGKASSQYRDGRLRWLHLVYGDGWSSQWWTDEPTNGTVTLTGIFSANLNDVGIDVPPHVRGRILRIHLVHKQVRPVENGWSIVDGTDRLTEIRSVPAENDWWPSKNTQEGDYVASGIVVELDLDDVPLLPTSFVAGALAVEGDAVWVMHSSDPILLRVQFTDAVPVITRYLLPMTIEPPVDRWSRRIHIVDDGCWITSEHDIHRCTLGPHGELSIDRYTTEGGGLSTVYEGRLYLVGSARAHLVSDRRHGAIRDHPNEQRLRVLNETDRRIVPVDGPACITATRADRATGIDGTQWCVDGTGTLRRIGLGGETSRIDLSSSAATGIVRWTTPNAFDDPANADVVARITY